MSTAAKVKQNIPKGWQALGTEDVVLPARDSIKIGPFGSQLKKSYLVSDGYKVYGQENVFEQDFSIGDRFVDDQRYKTLRSCELKPGDFIISMMGTIGKSSIVPEGIQPGIMDSHLLRLRVDQQKVYKPFLAHLFQSPAIQKQVKSMAVGGIMAGLSSKIIRRLEFLLPTIPEQMKIAEILDAVDKEIQKTNEIIFATEKLKRGLTRSLFSFRNRKDVRFITLGEIGKVSMCKRVFKNETSNSGEIPFYKIGTFGNEPDAFISQELFESYRKKFSFPKVGDILLSASGTIGRKVKYDGKPAYFQDSNIIWLEHDESMVLNSFLFYLYDTITWLTEGSTIKRLYNSILLKKIVPVPPIGTQKKIVEILSAVDEKVSVNRKLKQELVLLKKGLLQDLLSGKKRTI